MNGELNYVEERPLAARCEDGCANGSCARCRHENGRQDEPSASEIERDRERLVHPYIN